MTMALRPKRAIFWLARPPELDSLMVPVKGDFPPKDIRPEVGAAVPLTMPGARTSLLEELRGWQVGGTSSQTMAEVRPRPPHLTYFSGTSS